jgi:transaldolase
VLTALRMGADVATIPFKVIGQLINHPLTDVGLARFIADAAKIPSAS